MSREFWLPQLKILVASFLMAVFIYLPFKILDEVVFDTSKTVDLLALTVATGTIGMLVYAYFAMLFDIRELKMLTHLLEKFGPWQKILSTSPEVIADSSGKASESM